MPLSRAFSAFRWQSCQRVQRLLKALHRDDADVSGMAFRLTCVIPSGHEEDVNMGVVGARDLLADPSDRPDGSVEADLAGGRHPVAVVDVAAELLHHLEREREPGRGTADLAQVDADPDVVLALSVLA